VPHDAADIDARRKADFHGARSRLADGGECLARAMVAGTLALQLEQAMHRFATEADPSR
jgi:hypothetical protein